MNGTFTAQQHFVLVNGAAIPKEEAEEYAQKEIRRLEVCWIYAKTKEAKASVKGKLEPLYDKYGYTLKKPIWDFV